MNGSRERESGTGVALFMNTRALCDELGPKDTRTPSADTKGTDTDTKAQIQVQIQRHRYRYRYKGTDTDTTHSV